MIKIEDALRLLLPPPIGTISVLAGLPPVQKALEGISHDVWEQWVKTWRNILLDVYETVLSPYPVTYEEAVNNAANYLAKSSLLSTAGSFASVGKIIALAKSV